MSVIAAFDVDDADLFIRYCGEGVVKSTCCMCRINSLNQLTQKTKKRKKKTSFFNIHFVPLTPT